MRQSKCKLLTKLAPRVSAGAKRRRNDQKEVLSGNLGFRLSHSARASLSCVTRDSGRKGSDGRNSCEHLYFVVRPNRNNSASDILTIRSRRRLTCDSDVSGVRVVPFSLSTLGMPFASFSSKYRSSTVSYMCQDIISLWLQLQAEPKGWYEEKPLVV
jgi:hypothetical protein